VGFASENEVGRIRLGALATARLPDGARAQGAVSFVSRAADPATRTFRVEARGPNPAGPDQLRDGLTALIEVPLEARTAHRTPRVALTLDDAGRLGVRVVETAEGGGAVARFRPVRVLRDGPEGLFVAGLDGPTQVIVTGQEFVRDGAAVRATPRAEAPRD
ncbi:MAG: efflux RND transporter periplasmic adaptor subunit, partial [Pseudomonadota bacterium]